MNRTRPTDPERLTISDVALALLTLFAGYEFVVMVFTAGAV